MLLLKSAERCQFIPPAASADRVERKLKSQGRDQITRHEGGPAVMICVIHPSAFILHPLV